MNTTKPTHDGDALRVGIPGKTITWTEAEGAKGQAWAYR
jgi:hypothetical protein